MCIGAKVLKKSVTPIRQNILISSKVPKKVVLRYKTTSK